MSGVMPGNFRWEPSYSLGLVELKSSLYLAHKVCLRSGSRNTQSLKASLMASCQLAISAAGTTLYELCAMGIPTVSFAIADNQLSSACAFDHAGAIPFLGDVRSSGEEVIKKAASWAASKICHTEYSSLLSQSRLMQSLVDGQGALRIAKALLSPSHPTT